jgi:hypothetical protein
MAANGRRDFMILDADERPINDMSLEEHRLAYLWEEAIGAACKACCADWDSQPTSYWLALDAGAETIRPWHAEPPAAVVTLTDEDG